MIDISSAIALVVSLGGFALALYALRHGHTESMDLMRELRQEIDRLLLRVQTLEKEGRTKDALWRINEKMMRTNNIEPITADVFRETQQQIADDISQDAVGLAAKMRRAFDLDELKTLAFDMGYKTDAIKGTDRNRYVEELVALVERNGRLSELARLVVQQRPLLWQNGHKGDA